jgi:hypothetical protein
MANPIAVPPDPRAPPPRLPKYVAPSVGQVLREMVESQGMRDIAEVNPRSVSDHLFEKLGEAVVHEHPNERWLYALPHYSNETRVTYAVPRQWYFEVGRSWFEREYAPHLLDASAMASQRRDTGYSNPASPVERRGMAQRWPAVLLIAVVVLAGIVGLVLQSRRARGGKRGVQGT